MPSPRSFKAKNFVPVTGNGNRRSFDRASKFSSMRSQRPMVLVQASKKSAHYVDTALGTYPLNTTGSITLVNVVPQGASYSERIGKKIALKSLQVRGSIESDSTTTVTSGGYMIVYDRHPTGSLPAITDILESITTTAFNNTQNEGRFKIVARNIVPLTGNNTTAGQVNSNSNYYVDQYIKLKGLPTVYKAAGTGAIGDVETGALYIVTLGDRAAGTSDGIMRAEVRLRFYDMSG